MPEQFDYILAGTGCAGLSLALQLADSALPFQRILLIDQEQKKENDRTWCYWSNEEENWFPDLNFRTWKNLVFHSDSVNCDLSLRDLSYRMIRGGDFYCHCLTRLQNDSRFYFLTDKILSIESKETTALLSTATNQYAASFIFNSAFRHADKKRGDVNFVQHFKGWIVETETPVFDPLRATFMDFSIPQDGDCRFVYVLPLSDRQALVEYTGFSPDVIPEESYDAALAAYLKDKIGTENYKILDTEKGVIPMFESRFINPYGERIINLGTAGGASKASTGFTFYFIQQQVRLLITQLKNGQRPDAGKVKKGRFHWYDRVLLKVLQSGELSGAEIFSHLFKKNKASEILDFLNEKTCLVSEIRLMSTLPVKTFMKAALRSFF